MTVESGSFIDDLNPSLPTSGDPKSEGDDHLRLLKAAIKATFPNIDGAVAATDEEISKLSGLTASTAELNILDGVTANAAELNILDGATLSTAELNHVDGVTGPIQAQINAEVARATAAEVSLDTLKAPLASPALTGTPTAPTAAPGTNTTQVATMAALQQAAFAAALPAGVEGNFLSFQGGIWTPAQAPNQIVRLPLVAAYTVLFADRADLIDCTGTFTLSFDPAATLGSGWFAYVRNSGTGVITLDPNGAETIDGATTATVQPGETRLIQCDGTALRSIRLDTGTGGVLHVQDRKASGAAGLTLTGTIQNVREINTVVTNTLSGASLASNRITLAEAGTYELVAPIPCGGGLGTHRASLYNVTDAAYTLLGTNGAAANGVPSHIFGRFTTTASKTFEIRDYHTAANTAGAATSDGNGEVYLDATIRRIA